MIQGLLALLVAVAHAGAALATERIDLVNEGHARGLLLCLLEDAADAGGAGADDQLTELRGRGLDEGHAGIACEPLRTRRLA
eukprot:9949834-Heterocapsa_arctica.AAC.1